MSILLPMWIPQTTLGSACQSDLVVMLITLPVLDTVSNADGLESDLELRALVCGHAPEILVFHGLVLQLHIISSLIMGPLGTGLVPLAPEEPLNDE